MSHFKHQFLTDLKRLRWPLILYGCLLLIQWISTVTHLERGLITVNYDEQEFVWTRTLTRWIERHSRYLR
ncbi:MAG: hypothetical protein ACI8T1_003904 [Verrucomicrobiales bacterium]|jgi:hypothetical protein